MNGTREHAPGDSSRDRLVRISHHFLSETSQPLHLAMAADPARDAFLPEGLARGFAQLGKTAIVFDREADLVLHLCPATERETDAARPDREGETGDPLSRLTRRIRTAASPDVLITVSTAVPRREEAAILLIATPAQKEGMRQAYLGLKRLAAQRGTLPPLGAVIVGALDQHEAELGFRRFAAAVHRFLGLGVRSYSWLPAPGADGPERRDPFKGIAGLLLADCQTRERTGGPGSPALPNTQAEE